MRKIIAIILSIVALGCQKKDSISLTQSSNVVITTNYTTISQLSLITTMKGDPLVQSWQTQMLLNLKKKYTTEQLIIAMQPYNKPFYEKYKSVTLRSDYTYIFKTVFSPPATTSYRTCEEQLLLDNKNCDRSALWQFGIATVFGGWTVVGLFAGWGAVLGNWIDCFTTAKRNYQACLVNPYLRVLYPSAPTLSPSATLQPLPQ